VGCRSRGWAATSSAPTSPVGGRRSWDAKRSSSQPRRPSFDLASHGRAFDAGRLPSQRLAFRVCDWPNHLLFRAAAASTSAPHPSECQPRREFRTKRDGPRDEVLCNEVGTWIVNFMRPWSRNLVVDPTECPHIR
jgi:hypothetical protein